MTLPRLADYLRHMLEAMDRIASYVDGLGQERFERDQLIQDAVIRNIEVIGEASRRIEVRYPEFAREHPELPLSAAYQMRNAVAHGYFEVDLGIVWATIVTDLPALSQLLRGHLDELDHRSCHNSGNHSD